MKESAESQQEVLYFYGELNILDDNYLVYALKTCDWLNEKSQAKIVIIIARC